LIEPTKNKKESAMVAKKYRSIWIAGLLAGLAALMAMTSALAQSSLTRERILPPTRSGTITVPVFKSRIIELYTRAQRVSVGNPDVADILVLGTDELYVLGKDLGTTNVLLWDRGNNLISSIDIQVVHDLETLKQKLAELLPNEPIETRSAKRSIILSGEVSSLDKMMAAVQIAETFLEQAATATEKVQFEQEASTGGGEEGEEKTAGEVINLMHVGGVQQVMLEVKVAEIRRDHRRNLDVKFNALNNDGNWRYGATQGEANFPDALFEPNDTRLPVFNDQLPVTPFGPVIDEFAPEPLKIADRGIFGSYLDNDFIFNFAVDATKNKGLSRILAEPVLTTQTGQEANFLSGGEFAVPVPGDDFSTTIEYKEFGVMLRFLPIILDSGHINLTLNVEVSQLVPSTGVILPSGSNTFFPVKDIASRRASSTVELGDGQTIGIAGLINADMRSAVEDFPGIGNVPVLGPLFRSAEFQNNETELMIMVTPHLASPIAPEDIVLPTDAYVEPSDVDFYLLGRLEGKRKDEGGSKDIGGVDTSFGHSLNSEEKE
jgi:pilus assembly protein CpaC